MERGKERRLPVLDAAAGTLAGVHLPGFHKHYVVPENLRKDVEAALRKMSFAVMYEW